ncbi:MAG: cupin domain-containing protein [Thermoanaerobaculia bacterium]|nr:cupin domain-containing protein [Thermoanaerobaculia bacterium]
MSPSSPVVEPSLHGDLGARVVVRTDELDWEASPAGTVWRKRLYRVGDVEGGQVTSLVRFEPGASFAEHGHPDGEEILILEGTFADERGSWGEGWYLLSPEESGAHAPYSVAGCVLFVKLQQYGGKGRPRVQIDTSELSWRPTGRDGIEEKVLFRDARFPDDTRLERWAAGATADRSRVDGGLEIFVLEGELADDLGSYPAGTWLRLPAGARFAAVSAGGCRLYAKEGGVGALRGDAATEAEGR